MSAAAYALPGARWGLRMGDTGAVDMMIRTASGVLSGIITWDYR